jgi:hypothetical protein
MVSYSLILSTENGTQNIAGNQNDYFWAFDWSAFERGDYEMIYTFLSDNLPLVANFTDINRPQVNMDLGGVVSNCFELSNTFTNVKSNHIGFLRSEIASPASGGIDIPTVYSASSLNFSLQNEYNFTNGVNYLMTGSAIQNAFQSTTITSSTALTTTFPIVLQSGILYQVFAGTGYIGYVIGNGSSSSSYTLSQTVSLTAGTPLIFTFQSVGDHSVEAIVNTAVSASATIPINSIWLFPYTTYFVYKADGTYIGYISSGAGGATTSLTNSTTVTLSQYQPLFLTVIPSSVSNPENGVFTTSIFSALATGYSDNISLVATGITNTQLCNNFPISILPLVASSFSNSGNSYASLTTASTITNTTTSGTSASTTAQTATTSSSSISSTTITLSTNTNILILGATYNVSVSGTVIATTIGDGATGDTTITVSQPVTIGSGVTLTFTLITNQLVMNASTTLAAGSYNVLIAGNIYATISSTGVATWVYQPTFLNGYSSFGSGVSITFVPLFVSFTAITLAAQTSYQVIINKVNYGSFYNNIAGTVSSFNYGNTSTLSVPTGTISYVIATTALVLGTAITLTSGITYTVSSSQIAGNPIVLGDGTSKTSYTLNTFQSIAGATDINFIPQIQPSFTYASTKTSTIINFPSTTFTAASYNVAGDGIIGNTISGVYFPSTTATAASLTSLTLTTPQLVIGTPLTFSLVNSNGVCQLYTNINDNPPVYYSIISNTTGRIRVWLNSPGTNSPNGIVGLGNWSMVLRFTKIDGRGKGEGSSYQVMNDVLFSR